MNPLTLWVVLCIFAAVFLYEGYRGYRQTFPSPEDYFLGGRSLGVVAGFFTVMATLFSSFTYLGLPAAHYTQGVAYYALAGNQVLMGLIFYIVGTRLWILGRRGGFLNITDLLAARYESHWVSLVMAVVAVMAIVPYLGAQIRGGGVALSGLSGGAIPFWAGVAYIALIAMIYTMVGGFKSVVRTDVIQGSLMYIGIWLAAIVITQKVGGGFAGVIHKVQETSPAHLSLPGGLNAWTYPLAFSIITMFALGNFTFPQMNQRVMAARSMQTIKWTGTAIAIGGMVLSVPIVFIGLAGFLHYGAGGVKPADMVFPLLTGQFLPWPLAMLVLVGIVAAILSTADSILLSITSIIVKDIWVRYFNPHVDDARITAVSRLMVAVVLISSILVVIYGPPSILALLINVAWPTMFQTFPALIGGLFWQRATKYGAIASIVVGEAVLFSLTMKWWVIPVKGITPAIWGGLFGLAVFILVSLCTKPVSAKTLLTFFGYLDHTKKRAA